MIQNRDKIYVRCDIMAYHSISGKRILTMHLIMNIKTANELLMSMPLQCSPVCILYEIFKKNFDSELILVEINVQPFPDISVVNMMSHILKAWLSRKLCLFS